MWQNNMKLRQILRLLIKVSVRWCQRCFVTHNNTWLNRKGEEIDAYDLFWFPSAEYVKHEWSNVYIFTELLPGFDKSDIYIFLIARKFAVRAATEEVVRVLENVADASNQLTNNQQNALHSRRCKFLVCKINENISSLVIPPILWS